MSFLWASHVDRYRCTRPRRPVHHPGRDSSNGFQMRPNRQWDNTCHQIPPPQKQQVTHWQPMSEQELIGSLYWDGLIWMLKKLKKRSNHPPDRKGVDWSKSSLFWKHPSENAYLLEQPTIHACTKTTSTSKISKTSQTKPYTKTSKNHPLRLPPQVTCRHLSCLIHPGSASSGTAPVSFTMQLSLSRRERNSSRVSSPRRRFPSLF